jgi:phosphatidylglycerophosphatase A
VKAPPPEIRFSFELLLASGFGSGYFPRSPGTAGSLAFLVIWLVVAQLGLFDHLYPRIILALAVSIVGLWSCAAAIRKLGFSPDQRADKIDPQFIVIDEWAGMAITFIAVVPGDYYGAFLGFCLFRIFDIGKPGPVGMAERLPGSLGVMFDDIVAGLIAMTCLCVFGTLG